MCRRAWCEILDVVIAERTKAMNGVAPAVRRARWTAAGLVVIGVGLVAVAVLGPLVTGAIDYRVTESLLSQTIGLDAVSLFVVAPLCAVAAVCTVRGQRAGPALGLAIGAYTAYMFVQYVLGPDYAHLPGNNERIFPLALVLFSAGCFVALAAWTSIDVERLPRSRTRERRLARLVLPLLGFLAFVRYVPALADAMSASPEQLGYLAGPSFFWAIALLDLGIFLPATVATCVGLVHGRPWAQKAMYAVVGWFGLVGPAVAAMAISMYARDDPSATAANAVFMTLLGLAFAALAFVVFRPLFGRR
jgi:hypothetical protein